MSSLSRSNAGSPSDRYELSTSFSRRCRPASAVSSGVKGICLPLTLTMISLEELLKRLLGAVF